jgi:pyruvate-formate lyase-activating enzyme
MTNYDYNKCFIMPLTNEQELSLRMNQVETTLKHVEDKVDKIYNAIIGNQELDQEGYITRLKRLEEEIDKFKALKNKLVGAFVVGGAVWTIVLEFLKEVFQAATKHG